MNNLGQGLLKTKENFWQRLKSILTPKGQKYNTELVSNLEELLISLDIGLDTTLKIVESIEQKLPYSSSSITDDTIVSMIREEFLRIIPEPTVENTSYKPYITLVVGVNGVGKTTTIGKLAAQLVSNNKKVLLGAADTFRAGATNQLQYWASKAGADIVCGNATADPSSVVYDSIKKALSSDTDVVLIDTAGRLHTKIGLMDELSKIYRTIQKIVPTAPHEVLLVLDGTTGQNAFVQADLFTKATKVTALAITKLDGTAKGGIIVGIADKFQLPVKYIGLGEAISDLQIFDKQAFVKNVF
jgi:fused signal recognition particle receptor